MNHLKNLGVEILMKKVGALCMIACSLHPFCDPSPVLIVERIKINSKNATNHRNDGHDVIYVE